MILDPARPADAADLAVLHAAAFNPPWTAADLAQALGGPGGFGVLARTADRAAAGFILARAIAGEAEVLTLAVDPTLRRGGVGLALLVAAEGLARQNGAQAMFLEVAEDNVAALALYARAGFEAVGRRRGYYRRPGAPPVDAQVLRLDLNSRRP
jgi:ribosomal-protein-alanine N-acetyltransferase